MPMPEKILPSFLFQMCQFFRALAFNSLITLHINEQYGTNNHHIVEAIFKSLGRALKEAVSIDEANKDKVVSSKGVL